MHGLPHGICPRRDLVKWAPDENDESLEMLDGSNGGGGGGGGGGWDQFAANRTLFGVETTFDEHGTQWIGVWIACCCCCC